MIYSLRKYILPLILFSFSTALQANPCNRATLEVKGGYFFFSDKKMRSIYDEGGLDVQLSSSLPIWKCLQLYTSVEYLEKSGYSTGDNQKTSIFQVPVTAGLKACVRILSSVNYYLTLGPRYFYIHMHNDSPYIDKNLHKNGIGGFVGTGFTFYPRKHFIIDLFGEYAYEKAHLHASKPNVYTRELQVGGFVFGGGLGYKF